MQSRFATLPWAYSAGFALGGMQVGSHALHDNSFFVHLVTGRWILDHHAVPYHDVYSFTAPGRSFIAQSWLPETLYGVLERGPGAWAIRMVMGLVAAVIAVAAFRLTLRITGELYRAVGLSLAAFVVIGAMYSERPLAFGLLAFVALLWIVEVPESWLGRRPVPALVAVVWLWGNSHGSVALGIVYVGLHLVGSAIEGRRPVAASRERSLLVATLLALVVLCVNPYGPRLLWFPIALLGRGGVLADVVEWMSPDFHSTPGKAFALWLVVAALGALRGRRPGWRDVVVGVPFVLLGLWALRNLAIAVVVTLPVVARTVRRCAVEDEHATPAESVATPTRSPVLGVLGIGLVVATALIALHVATSPVYDLHGYSREAMRVVERNGVLGHRMFTTDANAGWVLARSWPRQRVFMDDRYDMFPDAVIHDYQRIAGVEPSWAVTLDRYRIDVVVWPAKRSLSQALALSPQWRRLEARGDWAVFVRDAAPR